MSVLHPISDIKHGDRLSREVPSTEVNLLVAFLRPRRLLALLVDYE
jgi:hypothetical protein